MCKRSPSCRVRTAIGLWQVPPSPASSARSAMTAARDGAWSIAASRSRTRSSPARHSIPIAPWAGAGSHSWASSGVPTPLSPSRDRPAAASSVTSASPAASRANRVATLPRNSTTLQSGRAWSICAARRGALVPTRAPCGIAMMLAAPTSTSRTSSRGRIAAMVSQSGRSVSTSFIECTDASIRPSRSQPSSSLVHSALPPISAKGRSSTLSPLAVTGTSSTAASSHPCAAHRRSRVSRAWAMASGDCRVPRRRIGGAVIGQCLP